MTEAPKWPSRAMVPEPHGFCAGVVRSRGGYDQALVDFRTAKEKNPDLKLYSVGEPAHNPDVIAPYIEDMIFVEDISEVEPGADAIQGPHGTSIKDIEFAQLNNINLIGTECPLVTRVRNRVMENTAEGRKTIYLGEEGHAEARAVTGSGDTILVENMEQALATAAQLKEENPEVKLAFANQTTKNADEALEIQKALEEQFPDIQKLKTDDICFATRDRQLGVKDLIKRGADALVIVGSPTSSNTMRMVEIADKEVPAFLIRDADGINPDDFTGFDSVGLHASASTPEVVFQKVIEVFKSRGSVIETVIPDGAKDESKIKFKPVERFNFSR